MKIQKFSLIDKIKYTLICTVGSALIFGPEKIKQIAGNNYKLVNLGLLIALILVKFIAQCYAELKRLVPEAGGDFLYIEKSYSGKAGTLYAVIMLCTTIPSCNAFFMKLIAEDLFGFTGKTQLFVLTLLFAGLCVFALIPMNARIQAMKILTLIQYLALFILAALIPIAFIERQTESLAVALPSDDSITALKLIKTISLGYFQYAGFFECNSLPSEIVGDLGKAYDIATTLVYLIYTFFINLNLKIYENSNHPISLVQTISFLGERPAKITSFFIQLGIYIPSACGNMFFANSNISFLQEKYHYGTLFRVAAATVMGLFSLAYSIRDIDSLLSGMTSVFLLVSGMSIYSILILSRNVGTERRKVSDFVVYVSVLICITMSLINIYFFINTNENKSS